jgi:hypothetical protein
MLSMAAPAHATIWVWPDNGDSAYVFTPPGRSSMTAHTIAPARLAGVASLSGSTTNVPVTAAAEAPFWEVSVPDGAGGAIVVWSDDRSAAVTGTDIYAQHVLAHGTIDLAWPVNGVPLTQAPGNDQAQVAASDGSGGAFVAWTASNGTPTAQHVLGNGTVDPAWPPNGLAVATTGSFLPQITPDGAHGAYVVWSDFRSNKRACIHHLLSSGVDPAWPTNGILLTGGWTGNTPNPRVCSDGAGGAIVAWDDPRYSGQINIFAQRVSASGSLLWASGGVPASTAPGRERLLGSGSGFFVFGIEMSSGAQSNPIVPDGAGGCFITWGDGRNLAVTGSDVYAQHLTSSGAVAAGWPANGQPMCTAAGEQEEPVILSDGVGGAIATWIDQRAGEFAQHVTGAGVVDGPVDGLDVGSPTTFGEPVAVSDGASGAILVWSDGRNASTSGTDVFAQHVKTSPFAVDPSWPVGGAPVSTAPGDAAMIAAAVSDGAGGAIAAWEDGRAFPHSGLYVQRIFASGDLLTTGPCSSTTFGLNGHVLANCPAPNTGLLGVTVDAYQVDSGNLVSTAATDATGAYSLVGLCSDSQYTITVVAPIGYAPAAVEIPADQNSGAVDFALSCLTANGTPRAMGYWKHEFGVATGGNGHGDYTSDALCSFLDLIAAHFNNNLINQVIVYQPLGPTGCNLEVARNLLNLQGSVAMIMKAKQQLMALLLNVAAGQISQTRVISADGATVSQAITYSDNLIDNPSGDYSKAITICDRINNGQQVQAGMIPLSTQNIEYAQSEAKVDFRVTNPARGVLDFHFSLLKGGPVELRVFDLAGRTLNRLVDGPMVAGTHIVRWDGTGAARSNLCFVRLRTANGDQTLKVLMLKP